MEKIKIISYILSDHIKIKLELNNNYTSNWRLNKRYLVIREISEEISKISRIKNKNENTIYQNPDIAKAVLGWYFIAMNTHIKAIREGGWRD